MDLILWRHAEAEVAGPHQPDAKRRLTARGDKQARDVARWLRQHLPKRCRILVSPAERTQETAHRLHLPYEIETKVGVGGTAQELLEAAGWPDAERAVLIIGHQPTLGQVASQLLGCDQPDLSVKKGGVWWFARRARDAGDETVLRAVINPAFL